MGFRYLTVAGLAFSVSSMRSTWNGLNRSLHSKTSNSRNNDTNAPYVLIAAPPGFPYSAIDVNQVRVTLHLMPGNTYKIQTTTNAGTTWVDVESGILAVDATLVRNFDVTATTQMFRVVQVN